MKFHFTVALMLLLTGSSFAQNHEFRFPDKAELEMNSYQKDPTAEAVVLFDLGESIFFDTEKGYKIRFTRTKRMKIITKAGVDHAEVSIPFYIDGFGRSESVKSIEAYTYNLENGRIVKNKMDQKTVYEEQVTSRWKAKKFVFPSVKEGSVIEYRYVLETPFHYNLPDWAFQDRIPTIYSRYIVKLIPFYEYVFLAEGITRFSYQKTEKAEAVRTYGTVNKSHAITVGNGFEFNDMVHTYVMKDIPALRDESYITSPDDYLMKLDFQLARIHFPQGGTKEIISTWPLLVKSLTKNKNFGKYIKGSRKYAKAILKDELHIDGKNDIEASKLIIDYVKANFSWNGYYSDYASKSPKDFMKQKTGNAADINLFLNTLLNTAGVKAYPVILSTRNHGKIKTDYPFSHFFNYVVVLIDNNEVNLLADGTENKVAFDRLPLRCINESGLVVDEENLGWVKLDNSSTSLNNKLISITIDPEALIAKSSVTVQSTEFESYIYKKAYDNDSVKLKQNWLNNGFTKISDVKTFNYEHNNRPYTIAFKGESPIEKLSKRIIISPFLDFPQKQNLLTQKKRTYPVDFIFATTKKLESRIEIPEGFEIAFLPEAYELDNKLATITINFTQNKHQIIASGSYTFKKAIYQPSEYARIKSYFNTIVKKFNEQIVLQEI